MASEFELSPRASKRRRTTRYSSNRTLLQDDTEDNSREELTIEQDLGSGINEDRTHNAPASNIGKEPPTRPSTRGITAKRTTTRQDVRDNKTSARVETVDLEDELQRQPKTPSRTSRHGQGQGKQQAIDSRRAENENPQVEKETKPRKGSDKPEVVEQHTNGEATDDTPKVRSSGRQRQKPIRYTEEVDDHETQRRTKAPVAVSATASPAPASPALKGILTPSKRHRSRPQKSVMFNQDEHVIGEQFGFRDIGTPAKTLLKTTQRKPTLHPRLKRASELIEADSEDDAEHEGEDNLRNGDIDDLFIDEPIVPVPLLVDAGNGTSLSGFAPTSLVRVPEHEAEAGIRSRVLSLLTSSALPDRPPSHLQASYRQLHSLLSSTVTASESNSLLLLGPRGVGKSLLVSLALCALSSTPLTSNGFHTVHLNGFMQTDDRLALREIWRQLGRERGIDVQETEEVGGSYADTMASLLSLLAHPDELAPVGEDQDTTMMDAEHGGIPTGRTSRSIIFVLDEFDLFTTHPRQTLLYNLFDIAQSRKAPIAVIGCSSRMDVIECLEKRVKSRFSHRWMLVSPPGNIAEWEACVRGTLLLDESVLKPVFQLNKQKGSYSDDIDSIQRWNRYIERSFLPSLEVQRLIKSHYYTSKFLPDLFIALYPLIATLKISDNTISPSALPPSSSPSTISTLTHLPTLHLSLLISSTRLSTLHHLPTTNFNLVHTHYTELIVSSRLKQSAGGSISTSGTLRQWSRETCRGAWEELGIWGLLVPAVVGGGADDGGLWSGGGEEEETRMWRCEVSLDEVLWGVKERFGMNSVDGEGGGKGMGGGAGEMLIKWCKEA